ncbi:MAG: ribonuclease H-like domain-containing protein [Pseudoxanthomonas sp.]|nr:ribonuclease H-like domain-containing protein [Pseudoxanthomonas sp.]
MSLTLARLQQLKRQAGGVVSRPSPPPVASNGPDIDQLRSLLRLRVRAPVDIGDGDRSLPGMEIAPGLHLVEEFLDDPVPASFDGAFDRGETIAAEDLLFFDTETTGLAGGTGTRAFMVGAADWCGGRLRIRQLLIARTAAETAMLDALAGWVHPRTVLCSYNGKCYDAPLLATRYRLARRAHPLAGLRHVDLLYPARRRYRGVYENCRLATIERQVLQVVREDDLPGSEAPAAWLGYLRGGDARLLRRVLAHNRQDVISLSRLLRHLSGLEPALA